MAIILKETNINSEEYIKILDDRTIINKNGIYSYAIVYKNIREREKEKNRENLFNNFFSKISNLINTNEKTILDKFNLESFKFFTDEHRSQLTNEEIDLLNFTDDLKYASNNFDKMFYIRGKDDNSVSKNFFNNLNQKIKDTFYKNGFQEEWVNDPIHIMRDEVMLISEYDQSPFTLNNFYDKYKSFCKENMNQEFVETIDC